MSTIEDGYYQEVENLRREVELMSMEMDMLRKCCSQRGARLQILWREISPTTRFILCCKLDAEKWFDSDGVPK